MVGTNGTEEGAASCRSVAGGAWAHEDVGTEDTADEVDCSGCKVSDHTGRESEVQSMTMPSSLRLMNIS